MRWERARRSSNVEDRRGRSSAGMVGGGGVGVILVVLVVSFLTGQNPLQLLQLVESGSGGSVSPAPGGAPPADDAHAQFIAAVLGDTEDTWERIFTAQGQRYQAPVLVLFDGMVASACGSASSAMGPFYCPADQQVYIDLSFFRDLDERFGAPGDFAQAYVIAHEVGHHIQTVTGISGKVQQLRARASEAESNALSVRQELQADCFAGVWGHHAGRRDLLDPGDVEEGLQAAAAIGDDRLQRQSGHVVAPESFTHGTSAQRVEWLRRGLETGDMNQCDTFEGGR
ncbi:MAG: neutral zinc metallopeptidase [Vicinamibacterales bacterium]|nr:neutral zinc metallopeptidase [Vicinamibacterales bacterium]